MGESSLSMAAGNNQQSTSIRRTLGNTPPTDVGRGIIRMSRSDAERIGAHFGSIVEVKSESGARAYAKCSFIHPDEETSYSGQVQLDSIIQRSLLGMDALHGFRTPITITKLADEVELATSITLEQLPGEDGKIQEKIDFHWLALWIEDKPVWKGSLIAVPSEGKMSLFRIVSVEPSPVALGTPLTKIKLQGADEGQAKSQAASSSLSGYGLNIQFRKGLHDFERLSEVLVRKGFTREDRPRAVAFAVPAGVDPDLTRFPGRESMRLPHPTLHRGSMMLSDAGAGIMIGHFRGMGGPSERSEEFVRDFEEGLPLIQEALEKELGMNLMDEKLVESLNFDAFYRVSTGKDSRPVLKSLSTLPDVPELYQLIGRKEDNEGLVLYPHTRDRSLQPKGLIQITIRAITTIGETAGYDVRFSYGLVDLASAIRLIHSSRRNAVTMIRSLEGGTSNSMPLDIHDK